MKKRNEKQQIKWNPKSEITEKKENKEEKENEARLYELTKRRGCLFVCWFQPQTKDKREKGTARLFTNDYRRKSKGIKKKRDGKIFNQGMIALNFRPFRRTESKKKQGILNRREEQKEK